MNTHNIANPTALAFADACHIWTECFDWPDLLTSPVVEAVECKVLEPKERILSKYSDFFIVPFLCQMCNIVLETLCATVCMIKNNSSVLITVHAIVGKLISRLIIIQRPLKS